MKSALTLITSLFLFSVASFADLLSMKKVEQECDVVSARATARKLLPLRDKPYQYDELMDAFAPYLKTEEQHEFYSSSLKLMFNLRPEQQGFPMFSCLEVLIDAFKSTIQFIANIEPEEDLRFPEPTHPVATITAGWQCLLKKLIKSKKKEDPDERVLKVKNALLDTLALHKPIIERLDPELFKIVNAHAPCENCVKSAKRRVFGN